MQLPTRIKVFVYVVVIAAMAGEAGAGLQQDSWPGGQQILVAAALAVLIALARRFPIHLAPKTKVLVDTAPAFTAVLVLPPATAALVYGVGMLAGEAAVREGRHQAAFIVAQSVLAGLLAAFTFQAVSAQVGEGGLSVLFPAAVAAVAMYGSNVLVVDCIVGLQLGTSPFADWWARHRQNLPQESSLFLLGLLPAVSVAEQPWTVLLITLPAVVAYRSLRDGVQLRIQTRETVETLADIIDMRDRYTHQHSQRVANLARRVAQAMGVSGEEAETVYLAARVHDVGKIGIRGGILWKSGPLTSDEWGEMRSHAEIGAALTSRLPEFRAGRELILHHHERFDGTGYPKGLAGEQIPLGARIITAADTFDALVSTRSYRPGVTPEQALAEIRRVAGAQLDPAVVEVLVRVVRSGGGEVENLEPQYVEPASAPASAAAPAVPPIPITT